MSDKELIEKLCEDNVFRESIESEYGKVAKIFPDWIENLLIYEFFDGTVLCSDLAPFIQKLKIIKYADYFRH